MTKQREIETRPVRTLASITTLEESLPIGMENRQLQHHLDEICSFNLFQCFNFIQFQSLIESPMEPYLAPTLAGSIDAEALPLTGVSVYEMIPLGLGCFGSLWAQGVNRLSRLGAD